MSRSEVFRTDIQGLRAIAIVSVVLYHALGNRVPGGFVGVDVFFVISGFLITRILLREIDAGTFSIAAFYARRVRRLFPALFAMLAAVLAAGFILLPSPQFAELGTSVAWTAVFAANLHQYRTTDYFAAAAEYRPLLHAWSLGVEEQFYIAFPLFLAMMSKYLRHWLKLALWLGVVGSLAWSCFLLQTLPPAAFYLPHARAFELGMGALLATGAIPRIPAGRAVELLSLAGLAMIVASFVVIDGATPYPGLAALLPCVGTTLVIHAGEGGETVTKRLLAVAPMKFMGAISYSLYLWHWPALVFARYAVLGPPGTMAIALSLASSFALACLSYRFIERPALRSRWGRRRILAAGAVLTTVTALCGAAVAGLNGLPQRFGPRSVAMFAASGDFNPRRPECHYQFDGPTDYRRTCVFGAPGVMPSVAVWADSFGAELSVGLGEQLAKHGRAVRELTASSCPPSLSFSPWNRPACADHNRAILDGLIDDTAIETVVLVAHYNGYGSDRDRMLRGLREAALKLEAAGKRIVLVYPVPTPSFDVPQALGMIVWRGGDPVSWGPAPSSVDRSTVPVRFLDALASETGAATIEPAKAFCSRTRCRTVEPDGSVLYFDDRHLSLAAVRLLLDRQPPIRALDE